MFYQVLSFTINWWFKVYALPMALLIHESESGGCIMLLAL